MRLALSVMRSAFLDYEYPGLKSWGIATALTGPGAGGNRQIAYGYQRTAEACDLDVLVLRRTFFRCNDL
jgi:hypothetical protein